jgi:hypothetical protein
MHPYCPDREHLIAQYETALRDYRIAVQALKGIRTGISGRPKQVERLHEQVKRARIQLERHRLEHGCGPQSDTSA